jgi:hypothetical protein
MPKKKKAKDDDWEAEADVIVETSKDANADASSSRLDALFAEAIARGKRTDGELDRATDELASGTKTEDELIAFYFPNEGLEDESAEAKAVRTRRSLTRSHHARCSWARAGVPCAGAKEDARMAR